MYNLSVVFSTRQKCLVFLYRSRNHRKTYSLIKINCVYVIHLYSCHLNLLVHTIRILKQKLESSLERMNICNALQLYIS